MRALLPVLLFALSVACPARAADPTVPAPDPGGSLQCMTSAIYHEAAREPEDGQRAVARVVLNRLADPAYPKSVCAVVYQGSGRRTGCQFSFTCDGALGRRVDPALWARASAVAAGALAEPSGLPDLAALHYHADYVRPRWAAGFAEERRIGRHIFYAGKPGSVVARSGATAAGRAHSAVFAVWGLDIARVSPTGSGVTVGELAISPAAEDGPGTL